MKTYEKVLAVILCVAGYGGASVLGAYSVVKVMDYAAKQEVPQAIYECVTWRLK